MEVYNYSAWPSQLHLHLKAHALPTVLPGQP